MQEKTKKIEVCFGVRETFDLPKGIMFRNIVDQLFEDIAGFNNNGGNIYQIKGYFEREFDKTAFKMEFYCTEQNLSGMLNHVEDMFNKHSIAGVEFVSQKVFETESFSFRVDK